MRTLADAEHDGVLALRNLGASNIAAARALSVEELLHEREMLWWPVVDHYVIAGDNYDLYQQGRYSDTPILIGTNSDEGALFVRQASRASFDAMIGGLAGHDATILATYPHQTDAQLLTSSRNIVRDSRYAWPTWTWARLQSRRSHASAVYVYYFDYEHARSVVSGPAHGADLPYVFGLMKDHRAQDDTVTNLMASYWTNFARTGNPNGHGLFLASHPLTAWRRSIRRAIRSATSASWRIQISNASPRAR
jgi:para-nitrobenzyl esterase